MKRGGTIGVSLEGRVEGKDEEERAAAGILKYTELLKGKEVCEPVN